jgi:hypothetical protein
MSHRTSNACTALNEVVEDVTSGKQDIQKYALRSTNITDVKSAKKKNQN